MTRLPTRIACITVLLLGGLNGCGQDEQLFPNPTVSTKADGGNEDKDSGAVVPTTPPSNTTTNPPTTTGPATSKLAAACSTDAQCGVGLTCVTSSADDFLGGGAANGYCTVDCSSAADDSFCEQYQAGALCMPTSDTARHCMPSCVEGVGGGTAAKCQGRADVMCDFFTFASYGVSYCRPSCGSDADCDGRKCHPYLGTCVDELPGTAPIGAECDPAATTPNCASGLCVPGVTADTQNTGFCSGLCTVGAIGCGETEANPVNPGAAFCANIVGQYSNVGDLGLCMQRCSCDGDCLNSLYDCLPLPNDSLGANSICLEQDTDLSGNPDLVLGVECVAGPDAGDGGGVARDGGSSDAATDAALVSIDGAAAMDAAASMDSAASNTETATAPDSATDTDTAVMSVAPDAAGADGG